MDARTNSVGFAALILLALIATTCAPRAAYLSPDYAPQLHDALAWVAHCDASKFGTIQQNVNSIIVAPQTLFGMGTGLAQRGGAVFLSEGLFDSSNNYFPQAERARYVGALIVHEARHEWQMRQRGYNPWLVAESESDARAFAASIYDCGE